MKYFFSFRSDYYAPEGNWFGSNLGNGTWNGLVGMIMRNEVHVVNVDMTWTAHRVNVVDFVTQIYQVKYVSCCIYYFNTCTVHLLLFCTMTNKCTIISQIITLLHVSTQSCYRQGSCNQYLAKLHEYFKCGCW